MNPTKVSNCCVLGDGSSASDHDHVSMTTPMKTKRKELMDDPMYKTEIKKGFDRVRETATTRARRDRGNVRPLDGGAARKDK